MAASLLDQVLQSAHAQFQPTMIDGYLLRDRVDALMPESWWDSNGYGDRGKPFLRKQRNPEWNGTREGPPLYIDCGQALSVDDWQLARRAYATVEDAALAVVRAILTDGKVRPPGVVDIEQAIKAEVEKAVGAAKAEAAASFAELLARAGLSTDDLAQRAATKEREQQVAQEAAAPRSRKGAAKTVQPGVD